MPANLENSPVATGLEKVTFHSSAQESNAKECSHTTQSHSAHMLAK